MGYSIQHNERDIKRAIIDYLTIRGHKVIPIRTTGTWTGKNWIKAVQRGVADLIGITKAGKFYALEVKQPNGKASREQEAFLESVRSFGCIGAVVRSVDDVIATGLLVLLVVSVLLTGEEARADMLINMNKIAKIESDFNPGAYNMKSGAIGLYQITTRGALADWNIMHKDEQYEARDLFDPEINEKIATWYLQDRIPQMLSRYGKPITVENILVAYNAGIKYVRDGIALPNETKRYIKKYHALHDKVSPDFEIVAGG